MKWLKWFIAGALAVPIAHQPALWAMHAIGYIHLTPYNMTPVKPFGVPSVISLSFWGGVWGIILGLILNRVRGTKFWVLATVIGAIAPTLVAGLVIMPLRGMAVGANPKLAVAGLVINAVWGFATAALWRATSKS